MLSHGGHLGSSDNSALPVFISLSTNDCALRSRRSAFFFTLALLSDAVFEFAVVARGRRSFARGDVERRQLSMNESSRVIAMNSD